MCLAGKLEPLGTIIVGRFDELRDKTLPHGLGLPELLKKEGVAQLFTEPVAPPNLLTEPGAVDHIRLLLRSNLSCQVRGDLPAGRDSCTCGDTGAEQQRIDTRLSMHRRRQHDRRCQRIRHGSPS